MTPETALGIILAHLVGDYLLQSHWMATEKTKRWWPAIIHGAVYTIPYVFVTQSPLALLVIGGTHVIIDRYRLAKHVNWARNQLGPRHSRPSWSEAKDNAGSSAATPTWLATFLMFVSDNTLHLLINWASVVWL